MPQAEETDDKTKDDDDDLQRKLLDTRSVVISQGIDSELVRKVINQLLLLESMDGDEPVRVFLNSPGGSADGGFAIYDMLRFIKPPVVTIAAGLVASAASIILLGTDRKNRVAFPNSRILLHQPSTHLQGVAADIEITAVEILKLREKANKLIAEETGQTIDKVADDTNRDYWIGADEAIEYGLVSRIVRNHTDL